MIAVSDSSPLITLARIGHFDLLQCLYQRIHISPQVYQEVVITGAGLPGSLEVSRASWIEVRPLAQAGVLEALIRRYGLGAGELSSITLAKEQSIRVVLLDDLSARKAAVEEGLAPRGCVGLLESAFRRGFLDDLRTAFCELVGQAAFVDRRLINERLAAHGLKPL